MYHWCKGELYDIEAMAGALSSKDKLYERIIKTEKKRRSKQSDLNNVTAGKRTMSTIFKDKNDIGDI